MMGIGFTELIIVALLQGNMSYPMGVPPAPENPLFAKIAPQECLFYTTWSGAAEPDPSSNNSTERLLADKEIQHTISEVERLYNAFAKQMSVRAKKDDPQMALATDVVNKWGRSLLTQPGAIYVSSFEPGPGATGVEGAVVLYLGGEAAAIKPALEKIQATTLGDRAKLVKVGTRDFHQFHVDPMAPIVTWGFAGNYLVIGFGEKAVENMFANATKNTRDGSPAWLVALRKQLPVKRVSTISYVNVEKIKSIAGPMLGGPAADGIINTIGFGNLKSYATVTGLDETGFVNRSLITTDGELKGVMKLADAKPLTADDLKSIPQDAPVAFAMRLNLGQVFDISKEIVGELVPGFSEMIEQGAEQAGEVIGADVRGEVLATLGDVWRVYASPSDGSLLTGWTASVDIADADGFKPLYDNLIAMAKQGLVGDEYAPEINEFKFGSNTVYYLSFKEAVPITLAWCASPDELVFGLSSQAVKAHLVGGESLATQPEVATVLQGDGPIVLTYVDTKKVAQILYPMIQFAVQAMMNDLDELPFDSSILPSLAAFDRHLKPSVSVVRRTSAGIESYSHQTLPSGNVVASAPVMAAVLFPAIQSAQIAARRTQSVNQLKQLGLAMHNYNDTYRNLPAAYSVDKDGKPLLSWRVLILPFIEQIHLYEQFRLNEPWDSEHNIKLIDKMPPIYRSPGSKAPSGKSTIHMIGGEHGLFGAPRENAIVTDRMGKFRGTTFGQVTDGLSNTIMAVEAGEESAVEWTKPVEFKPDEKDPVKGFLGVYSGGFHALIADGSVFFFPDSIDAEMLKRFLSRNDGQRVEFPSRK